MDRKHLAWSFALPLALAALPAAQAQNYSPIVGNTQFTVQGLVGVGRLPSNLRDAYGETFGSISGLTIEPGTWARTGDSYTGTFLAMPDRGYNAVGTIDYTERINSLAFSFTPAALGTSGLGQNQISLNLVQSTRLYEMTTGSLLPISGLDPVPGGLAAGGARVVPGLGELPQAYNGKLALDAEGIVVLADGSRLVSDEYGPSVYRFSPSGQLIGALPVASSVRPIRNGVTDYSSNNPTAGQPAPVPPNPTYGRSNNQGFEGLSLSPDGNTLFVALQSAARQDGAAAGAATRDTIRVFTYDVSDPANIAITGEYVAQLPKFTDQNGATVVAAQSEIVAVSDTQLLILPRDSNGLNVGTQQSFLRRVDVLDLSGATNIWGTPGEGTVAPGGVLNPGITKAAWHSWLDINTNSELMRFGLYNGILEGYDDLSEKWEGLALLPALDPEHPNDYFLFVANDNDFATTDGFQVGTAYNAGWDNDTTFLAWRVTIGPVPEPGTAGLLLVGAGVVLMLVRRRRT